MAESMQHWLDRNRPPRVQITYDVETGGAIQKKELPLVVGIMADLSGNEGKAPPIRERKFVEIDRDSFNGIMDSIKPTVKASDLKNHLDPDGSPLSVTYTLTEIDDFEPGRIVMSDQVPELKHQMNERQRLTELLTKLDGNDDLVAFLSAAVTGDKVDEIITQGDEARARITPAAQNGNEGEES